MWFNKTRPHLSYSLRPSAWRLQWGWLEGHPAVKFRTKTPMNSQQLSLESCNSWETVQPVLAWTIHRWRLDAKCLVVVVVVVVIREASQTNCIQCEFSCVTASFIKQANNPVTLA